MLFLMDLANNHNGQVARGEKIIDSFAEVCKDFPNFNFVIKFQRRSLDNLIHPAYQDRTDIPYIKRFKDTQLSLAELKELVDYAKDKGFLTACTPFDEVAVDEIATLDLDYVKIGSCSINDWPLLNKIANTFSQHGPNKLAVIASVGGINTAQVNKVISFFNNRNIDFAMMHCVGLYPTQDSELNLNRIRILKGMLPDKNIGFSTHESPENLTAIGLAIAAGASIFEKHIDLKHVNKYSVTPEDYRKYLQAAQQAEIMCYGSTESFIKETKKLRELRRGAFLKQDVQEGNIITRETLRFVIPIVDDKQFDVFNCSKYRSFKAVKDLKANQPLCRSDVLVIDNSTLIDDIQNVVKKILDDNYVVYPPKTEMEISHHYGLDKFYQYGMCLITLINEKYCKKLLVILPGQENPAHKHNKKKETFFVLSGEAIIIVNDIKNVLKKGDLITIEPGQVHSISSTTGCIIEELSTRHRGNDSTYVDDGINKNLNRKTVVHLV